MRSSSESDPELLECMVNFEFVGGRSDADNDLEEEHRGSRVPKLHGASRATAVPSLASFVMRGGMSVSLRGMEVSGSVEERLRQAQTDVCGPCLPPWIDTGLLRRCLPGLRGSASAPPAASL